MSLRNASARLAPTGGRIALHLHMTDVTRDAGATISLIGLDDANSAATSLTAFLHSTSFITTQHFSNILSKLASPDVSLVLRRAQSGIVDDDDDDDDFAPPHYIINRTYHRERCSTRSIVYVVACKMSVNQSMALFGNGIIGFYRRMDMAV
eukprot:CAMPEP_0168592132 /NCGR_PEP_ID=MMETSP0420-20121227/7538_1 /TAXON_ID=498008 /ORGANISM="Pessonella sp." /LENGTH=150 /DNA_ID=CAMNT_0008628037 /DNA_START=350 /DNA_END=798 /DNA_ORIENTATION=-